MRSLRPGGRLLELPSCSDGPAEGDELDAAWRTLVMLPDVSGKQSALAVHTVSKMMSNRMRSKCLPSDIGSGSRRDLGIGLPYALGSKTGIVLRLNMFRALQL